MRIVPRCTTIPPATPQLLRKGAQSRIFCCLWLDKAQPQSDNRFVVLLVLLYAHVCVRVLCVILHQSSSDCYTRHTSGGCLSVHGCCQINFHSMGSQRHAAKISPLYATCINGLNSKNVLAPSPLSLLVCSPQLWVACMDAAVFQGMH